MKLAIKTRKSKFKNNQTKNPLESKHELQWMTLKNIPFNKKLYQRGTKKIQSPILKLEKHNNLSSAKTMFFYLLKRR